MNPTTVRNLLLSLGLATGLGGSTNGCSSQAGTPPEDGAGGSGLQGTGGFCGNCLGQNAQHQLGGADGKLDAAADIRGDAGGETLSADPGEAGTDQADPNGG